MPKLSAVIAANVRAERARRRWQQIELADRIGWSRSSVAAIEAGQRKITVDHLSPLCLAFGVEFSDLIRGADQADLDALGLNGRVAGR